MHSSVARELLNEISIHACLQEAARTRAGHNASVFSPLFYLLIHRHFRNRFYSFIALPPFLLHPLSIPSEILRSLYQGPVNKSKVSLARFVSRAKAEDVRGRRGEI